ncbi:hypothetical protein CLAFUW4_01354 [Fulvia fulva]|uniref:Uncharacterized protein n=1 Tax=Passalora fulva TaxID=5499 RepID=A0A9Q8L632_PASFU|nr:uncharacterized protein CLAFUR5_01357 [Fulvia fulva]KAK4634743.1 hypothetical protein CLAFUR4_01355 [Fulvia fulva]KAK4637150.1 hypothetical protein CLAFUR0_01356 [Fulvia fulva]UJO11556.1 hypothetical protein CLAFUR5_01357 [Fulvia fulva]WPV10177.1 hypothetical protein CLAFUW4_01354 [Fulvia fulva]WPV24401.1 hypothetical protein CLAFUW7_01359 [Fulvia fulva]
MYIPITRYPFSADVSDICTTKPDATIRTCSRAISIQYSGHFSCAVDTAVAISLAVLFALLVFQVLEFIRNVVEVVRKWPAEPKQRVEKPAPALFMFIPDIS